MFSNAKTAARFISYFLVTWLNFKIDLFRENDSDNSVNRHTKRQSD